MSVHAIAAQAEFEGFPEGQADAWAAENPVVRYLRLSRESGGLIPQHMLPAALDLSKQRVSQLINSGRFELHEIAGTNYVTAHSFGAFLAEERKSGRPVKAATSIAGLVKRMAHPQPDED